MTYEMRKQRRATRRESDGTPQLPPEPPPRRRAQIPWRLLASVFTLAAAWVVLMGK